MTQSTNSDRSTIWWSSSQPVQVISPARGGSARGTRLVPRDPFSGTIERQCVRFSVDLDGWLKSTVGGALPIAVVLGGGVHGLSYARSLGRRGVPVLVAESPQGFVGKSRYVRSVTLGAPSENADEWVEFLVAVGKSLPQRGALFAVNDVLVELVAVHADRLEEWFHFVVPDAGVVRSILDKRFQYETARKAGVALPTTFFPESAAEVEEAAAMVRYPALFKPYEAASGRAQIRLKALRAHEPDELVSCFRRFATSDTKFMVQEFVPGDDTALVGYLAFWDRDGRERAWMTKAKVRQYPSGVGDGSFQVSVTAPEVAEVSRCLLRAFKYRGLVSVEFKRDARDNSYQLMEINPRTVLGNPLAISAGVDFPWIVYRYLTRPDEHDAPVQGFRVGVKHVNEELDLRAFLALRKERKLTSWQWIRQLAGARSWAVASIRDPQPLLHLVCTHSRRQQS